MRTMCAAVIATPLGGWPFHAQKSLPIYRWGSGAGIGSRRGARAFLALWGRPTHGAPAGPALPGRAPPHRTNTGAPALDCNHQQRRCCYRGSSGRSVSAAAAAATLREALPPRGPRCVVVAAAAAAAHATASNNKKQSYSNSKLAS